MAEQKRCILVVDDEVKLLRALGDFLTAKNFHVLQAATGDAAVELFCEHMDKIDVVLLDYMLPGRDGISVLQEIRERSFNTPVIMLTAKGEEYDQLAAFQVGADDYVTKPFSITLLLARIEAVLRRFGKDAAQDLSIGACVIHNGTRTVEIGGQPMKLTRREFDLLCYLASNPGQAFSREQLLDHVWGYQFEGGTRTVDTHIRQLRKKMDGYDYLKTVHCIGYKFEI